MENTSNSYTIRSPVVPLVSSTDLNSYISAGITNATSTVSYNPSFWDNIGTKEKCLIDIFKSIKKNLKA